MLSFFCLEEKDLCSDGDMIQFSGQKLIRGKDVNGNCLDYFQPPESMVGVGLNVEEKFDNGDATWLAMDYNGNGKEWAVAYHGIRAPHPEKVPGSIAK